MDNSCRSEDPKRKRGYQVGDTGVGVGRSDTAGPFMSLIVERLDLNKLRVKNSELTDSEDGINDDLEIMTDSEEGKDLIETVQDIDDYDIEEPEYLRGVTDSEDEDDDEDDECEMESDDIQMGEVENGDSIPRNAKERRLEDSYDDEVSLRRSSRVHSNASIEKQTNGKPAKGLVPKSSVRTSRERGSELITKKNYSAKDSDYELTSGESDTDSQEAETPRRKPRKSKFTSKRSKKDTHQEFCRVCKDGGELLCCDSCPHVFHISCLDPPLSSMPEGSWQCFACCVEPLEKVDKIFTWRETAYGREFFVHFTGKSHWQCRWVPDVQLQVLQPILVRCYYKKYGKDEPPNLDAGDARRLLKNQQDPLERRFYQFGVRPDWLRIDRIIDHQAENDGRLRYLVKWQQLGYESVTWEDKTSCKEIIKEFTLAVKVYHEWLNYFWGDPGIKMGGKPFVHKYVTIPPNKLISNLKKKLEKQPDYIPDGMVLHDYQLDGLNWLRYSWAKGINTILGDEMGLGKTIQTIVFLSSLYREGHCKGPFLISAPLSTLLNWEREFQTWAPEMYVVTYTGEQDTRLLIRKTEFVQDSSYMTSQRKRIHSPVKFHVLLTSYQFPSMDATSLGSIPWEMIVVDEGHRLKNDSALLFKDLMNYSTSYKLLLTGTPLQNNLEELFNLLNFLCPEKFDDVSNFLTEFEDIAKADQIKKLHSLLGPHLLRRMKADVLKDMPTKSELIVRVELSPMQKQYSKHILMKNFKALNSKGGRHTSLLNVFVDLRKVCNHPYLFSKACSEAPEDPVTGMYELEAMTEASGKLIMLRKMLELLKKQGHRVLIFSQMTTMMDILEEFLTSLGHLYERIDGSILGSKRQDAIDRFNAEGAEQFVFLLSTKAGGLGINLATADTVIIFDSDWNPHNDIQAYSRSHRIGQKNKVMIYRFVTRRSVEEKIAQVCKRKMMLTHLVVRPEVSKSLFSRAEVDEIIRFGTEELFKDQDADAQIYYTDATVESILDRTKEEEVKEKSDWMNDYFQGFKVANCEVQEDVESKVSESESKDPDQWKYLLRQEIKKKEDERNDLSNYGKGKRKRSIVKYQDRNNKCKTNADDSPKKVPRSRDEDADSLEWRPPNIPKYKVMKNVVIEQCEDTDEKPVTLQPIMNNVAETKLLPDESPLRGYAVRSPGGMKIRRKKGKGSPWTTGKAYRANTKHKMAQRITSLSDTSKEDDEMEQKEDYYIEEIPTPIRRGAPNYQRKKETVKTPSNENHLNREETVALKILKNGGPTHRPSKAKKAAASFLLSSGTTTVPKAIRMYRAMETNQKLYNSYDPDPDVPLT